jgi:hypothetical protein
MLDTILNYQNTLLACIIAALGALILLISWVQNTGVTKQSAILAGVSGFPVSDSAYYKLATNYFTQVQPVRLAGGYTLPILFLFALVSFCGAVSYFAPQWSHYLATPNYILGGTYILGKHSADEIGAYQSGTVLMGSMAFVGAYVYILRELISRINNNDISPITYYYFCIRIITATMVAGVVRHVMSFLDPSSTTGAEITVVIGFVVGLRPDLWITLAINKITKRFGLLGEQADPAEANVPSNFSLLLIEGLTEDKRSRLEELDIDNCQALASHNPFIIWARTSYQLLHIVDWMAQAQLAVLVSDVGIMRLRLIGIRNIFALVQAWSGPSAVQVANQIPPVTREIAADLLSYILASPDFKRLEQVYKLIGDDAAIENRA